MERRLTNHILHEMSPSCRARLSAGRVAIVPPGEQQHDGDCECHAAQQRQEHEMNQIVVRRKFQKGMEDLLIGLKYHIETGELVGDRVPDMAPAAV